jgi:hypothetical protein
MSAASMHASNVAPNAWLCKNASNVAPNAMAMQECIERCSTMWQVAHHVAEPLIWDNVSGF